MKEQLESIQNAIKDLEGASLSEKRKVLEPLFYPVYEECKQKEIDIIYLLKLSQLENQLSDRILPVIPKIEPTLEENQTDKILEKIVSYARKKAISIYQCNLEKDSLRTRSLDLSNLVLEMSKSLQVPTYLFDIGAYFHFPYPHYVVLSYVEDGYYFIDITYQEFFMLGYNFSNRYYEHPSYIRTCEIGGRMIKEREKSAEKMIYQGYLPILSKDFQNYCDACSEFGNIEKRDVKEHLKEFLKPIERSSDKNDRILVSKMQYLQTC
jgi:hypothetical protein